MVSPTLTRPRGDRTRQAILEEALQLATVVGLHGLTIGTLATRMEISKSGLFAHFGSKEALQQAVIETGVAHFMARVIRPALLLPSGVAAVRALFDGWIHWSSEEMAGGCLFITAAVEFDDRPGAVRDQLVELHHQWLEVVGGAAVRARASGAFRADLDEAQFAHDFHAILLGFNQARRLVNDPDAKTKAERAFQRLLRDASVSSP
ncbi:MAG: TetR/AcrR family transcriptional regulator [Gemmatimonadetes bacterium]|nr:TetR/AcrR family transcriptional regulator [Gemmatimonadota bacterium]